MGEFKTNSPIIYSNAMPLVAEHQSIFDALWDRGRGIPDGLKEGAFKRYLETAKGSGLGLSIVYALVTDRYGGRVALKNRVKGDFTKGTTAEIWLPRP